MWINDPEALKTNFKADTEMKINFGTFFFGLGILLMIDTYLMFYWQINPDNQFFYGGGFVIGFLMIIGGLYMRFFISRSITEVRFLERKKKPKFYR